MKRCPQCEFIYEDDQSLCDMDGVLLVLDSRTLPNLHELATVDAPVVSRAIWRQRTFPAMAALIFATVLSLVYFLSTQQGVPSVIPEAETSITTMPISNPPALENSFDSNSAPPPTTEGSGTAATVKDEPKPEPTKAPASPVTKKSSRKTPATQNETVEPKKDDSKVNSILKKTGRILKKPFKF
jgi:hypothetical protein